MCSQISKALEHEKATRSSFLVDVLVLQAPGGVVRDEDGVEASREGGIDV